MDSQLQRDEIHRLESKPTAVRAVVNSDEPDWRRRCEDAAAALRRVLNLPDDRAGSWGKRRTCPRSTSRYATCGPSLEGGDL